MKFFVVISIYHQFLFLSAVFGYLPEIPLSNKDYVIFAVSHIYPLPPRPLVPPHPPPPPNIGMFFIVKLWKSKKENEENDQ